MFSGRRVNSLGDAGDRPRDRSQDFAFDGIVQTPRRPTADVVGKKIVTRKEWSAAQRRDITKRAILVLRKSGFRPEEIAVALQITERCVYKHTSDAKTVAESHGRV